jgi:hypothetical protein
MISSYISELFCWRSTTEDKPDFIRPQTKSHRPLPVEIPGEKDSKERVILEDVLDIEQRLTYLRKLRETLMITLEIIKILNTLEKLPD